VGVIVLDTTVLVYATGAEHPAKDPCGRLIDAVGDGRLDATTTVEVIQAFVHVRAPRAGREAAAELGQGFVALLRPLLAPDEAALTRGLGLYQRHGLGMFDAVLAATALERDAAAVVSADRAFASVPALRHLDPVAPTFVADLGLTG
jgi:predicted nucleic acid-binding protein